MHIIEFFNNTNLFTSMKLCSHHGTSDPSVDLLNPNTFYGFPIVMPLTLKASARFDYSTSTEFINHDLCVVFNEQKFKNY